MRDERYLFGKFVFGWRAAVANDQDLINCLLWGKSTPWIYQALIEILHVNTVKFFFFAVL